jgi:SAM-dependent methyltransferase
VLRHVRARGRGGARAWVVHRLDREVSGLMLFARSERALAWLKQELRARRIERSYLALVEGELGPGSPAGERGSMSSFLHEGRERVHSVAPEAFRGATPGPDARGGDARLATTHYRVLSVGRGCSALELSLETGRKHQIRVHLQQLGHPVLGDVRYGARGGEPRVWLHAARLAFHAPDGRRLELESESRELWARIGARAPKGGGERGAARVQAGTPPAELETSWDEVAHWYDDLLERRGSDHYRDQILPGAVRLLEPRRGQRILDLACGQGVLARRLAEEGVRVVGLDASERLIESARRRTRSADVEYAVADARALDVRALGPFDAIACVMALANIEPIEPLLRSCAQLLRPGGIWLAVLPHPAFRAARQSAWGWDRDAAGGPRQYRRIDGYLSPGQVRIVANPGAVARGEPPVETWTFHRPLQSYVRALASAGFWIDALEEWPSLRSSQPGPRASAENRARREIPLFLALRARRISA